MLQTTKLISQVIKSFRYHFDKNNYTEVVVPRVVRASGACENVDTLFDTKVEKDDKWFNNKRGYLAQTGQLYLEALVPKLGNVYCIGPSFRAEPKVDNRHLTEFLMIEIEHPGNFDELLNSIQSVVYQTVSDLANMREKAEEMGISQQNLERLTKTKPIFPQITYDEAIKLLQKHGHNIEWGDDISSALEKELITYFGGQPLFITRFPDPMWDFKKEIEVEKFFNMLPDPENPGRVLSCDLILPHGGEAVGAAARVHEPATMIKRLKSSRMFQRLLNKGGSMADFEWYINQLKENGSVPHAGCGFGMARIIQWLKGETDIRNCVTFASNKQCLI